MQSVCYYRGIPCQVIQPFHQPQPICLKVGGSKAPIQPLDMYKF